MENNKTKWLVLTIIIILVVAVGLVFAFRGRTNRKEMQNKEKQAVQSNSVKQENIIEEKTNEIEEEKQEEPEQETVEPETEEETPQTNEQKALKIVEDDWNASEVTFYVQGMDNNGNYIVTVSDADTKVLAFYTVNVEDGTFTKRETN